MVSRVDRALIAGLLVLTLTGCGKFFRDSTSSGGGNTNSSFVYAAASQGVFAFRADLTAGTLTALNSGNAFPTSNLAAQVLTIDPQNRFLFVGTSSGLNSFIINSDGGLTPVNQATTVARTGPSAIAITPSGNFLYILDASGATISGFSIQSDGTLAALGTALNVTGTPSSLAIDPSGTHLYATLGGQGILTTTINQDGTLNTNATIKQAPAGSPVSAVLIPRSGKNLYATTTGGVFPFTLDSSTGLPTELSPVAVSTGSNPVALTADSASSFLFVANHDSNNISAFAIVGSNGNLTPISGSPFAANTAPTDLVLDPTNKFLFVSTSQGIQTFSLSTSVPGSLTSKGTTAVGTSMAAIVSTH
jgi:6-phosphogluconolactonase